MKRKAACACGRLKLTVTGDPVRISVCHCLDCQRRTGSAFGVAARFSQSAVSATGGARLFERKSDTGATVSLHFCGECGSTLYWRTDAAPDFVSVAVGAFADPSFAAPTVSIYEARRHRWAKVDSPAAEHID